MTLKRILIVGILLAFTFFSYGSAASGKDAASLKEKIDEMVRMRPSEGFTLTPS